MPGEFAKRAPNRVTDSSGYSHLMIEGRLSSRRRWGGGPDRAEVFASHIERSRPGMTDPLESMTRPATFPDCAKIAVAASNANSTAERFRIMKVISSEL